MQNVPATRARSYGSCSQKSRHFFSAQVPVSPGRTVCLMKEKTPLKSSSQRGAFQSLLLVSNARRLFIVDKP